MTFGTHGTVHLADNPLPDNSSLRTNPVLASSEKFVVDEG